MNLTQTAVFFKRWSRIVLLILGAYYGWMFFGGPGVQYLIKLFYVTKEPPNPIYGNLEPLEFVNKDVSGDQIYKLNTKNGKLPGKFPYKMNVYKFKVPAYSYLAGDTAEKDAEYLGYAQADLITDLKGTIYRWRKTDTNSFLEIDIHSRKIFGDSDMIKNSTQYQIGTLTEAAAKTKAVNFFARLGRFDETYKLGTQEVTQGYVGGTRLTKTTTQRDVQFARVDLYRKIDDYKVLTTDPRVGNLSVYLTNPKGRGSNIIAYPKISGNYKEIDLGGRVKASYPIIDITTAWKAVKDGKGVITNVLPNNQSVFDKETSVTVNEILIDNIYLAYYESTKEQAYLQPIYVFEGKYRSLGSQGGDITIYLPAVSGEYVKPVPKEEPPVETVPVNN